MNPSLISTDDRDTSKAKVVFSKSLFGSFTDPKLSIRKIYDYKLINNRYRANIKGIPYGLYWLRLQNIPKQNGKIVGRDGLPKEPTIIELILSLDKATNIQVGDDFILTLGIKNFTPLLFHNVEIFAGCSGQRLKSISPENIKKEETRYNTKLIVDEIKPKEKLIINLNYYAASARSKLICEAHFGSFQDGSTFTYGKVDGRELKKEASKFIFSNLKDLAFQLTEARWSYCRTKTQNSSKDLVKECAGIMAKKDFECLRKDKTLSEAKACAENIYGNLPSV